MWISDTRAKGTVITTQETPRSYLVDSPKGIVRCNRSQPVIRPVAPLAETSGHRQAPVLENETSVVGPDGLCSDNFPVLPNRQPPKYLKDFVHS